MLFFNYFFKLQNSSLKTYFEEPYDEEFDKIPIFEDFSTIGSSLKFKGKLLLLNIHPYVWNEDN